MRARSGQHGATMRRYPWGFPPTNAGRRHPGQEPWRELLPRCDGGLGQEPRSRSGLPRGRPAQRTGTAALLALEGPLRNPCDALLSIDPLDKEEPRTPFGRSSGNYLLSTRVNKGKKKGRGFYTPTRHDASSGAGLSTRHRRSFRPPRPGPALGCLRAAAAALVRGCGLEGSL
jgi:hypothetical protein